ncbi:MAG: ISL3 family transposase [Pseudomonadota bacterium]
MSAKLFEAALGIVEPWFIQRVDFDTGKKTLTIGIDFIAGSRFAVPGVEGTHPAHDTVTKRYRHLNFFQHECHLEVRVPRVRLPDGGIRQVEPDWAGRLAGFTLLFEALIMAMCREMTFAAVSRLVGLSWHQVVAICKRYVELGLEQADFSAVTRLAADETSKARGHDYITLVADADQRRVLFVTEGRDADTIKAFAADFTAHGGDPQAVESISIDMSPAFVKGVTQHLPNARITFDKFHIIAHASTAVDKTRRLEQKSDPSLKGLRWKLLRDRASLTPDARADLDALIAQVTTKRTARAWLYKEQLREILERKQVNVVRAMLTQWATNVMRSKVEPMKEVAKMIRTHLDGIVAWTQTRQTNGFLEAINGLFQAAKRKARGYGNFSTIRTVIFLLAGKLDFSNINPHAA